MPGFSVEPEALCNRRSVPSSEARPDQGQTAYNAERYTPYPGPPAAGQGNRMVDPVVRRAASSVCALAASARA